MSIANSPTLSWRSFAIPTTTRGLRQFAEEEVICPPPGQFKGLPFRVSRQPFSGILLDEIDHGGWQTIIPSGPTQSSKTLCGFCLPTLHAACELRENVVLGIPEADMADDKWRIDFEPVMRSSPNLEWLLPRKGAGSKGGKVKDNISLSNGVDLKLISTGGQDTAKAGYTARFLNLTEAAGWSHATGTSKEADTFRQLRARMRGFPHSMQRLICEGTVTVATELPWRMRGDSEDDFLVSTQSELLTPCPHCHEWIVCKREHLKGWQTARSEIEAMEKVFFVCPSCTHKLTDEDRRKANQDVRLVHHGQSVNEHGDVIGPRPEVTTLWFHWEQWHNLLVPLANTALDCWRNAQIEEGSEDRDNSEREQCMFVWSMPYVPTDQPEMALDPRKIRKRKSGYPANILPPDVTYVTVGIDPGKWTAWWLCLGLCEESQVIAVPNYGPFAVCTDESDAVELTLLNALRTLRDDVLMDGFLTDDGQQKHIDEVWIDGGWLLKTVCQFAKESNRLNSTTRFSVCRGRGQSKMGYGNRAVYNQPKKKTKNIFQIGERYYDEANYEHRIRELIFDADYWKLWFQRRFTTPVNARGSIALFTSPDPNQHVKLSHHIANESIELVDKPGKGIVKEYVRRGQNHLLDCGAIASCAGHRAGFRILKEQKKIVSQQAKERQAPSEEDERMVLATERGD